MHKHSQWTFSGAVQYTTLLQYDTDNVTVQSSLKMRTLGPILQGER